jgi:ATP-dependent RNA helicase RhlE
MESFSRLGLAEPLAAALASFGFETPTPVQLEAIPAILDRRDAIIESETGTGKTFAYLAPAFQLVSVLERKGVGEPGVIIASPTQELAVQIGRESERLAKAAGLDLKTVVLLGGTAIDRQIVKLKSKPEIIVGTLGRLADLVALGKIRTTSLKVLVLDEADRLFANETEELARALLKSAGNSCTRVLVSATIPERIRREMRPLLREPLEICPVGETVMSGSIEHWCFYCDGRKRLDFARRFEAAMHPERCLMFLSMATRVEKAAQALAALGLPVGAIHAGMEKEERHVALERFSNGEIRYLLTSDLGARGLDIPGITHILSLDLPEEPTVYTHRAGRTGRAGATGVSIVLADGVELARASKIATKGGFVFRTKVLEEGKVLEPTSEEFFARASAAEQQRMSAKAANQGDPRHEGGGYRRPQSDTNELRRYGRGTGEQGGPKMEAGEEGPRSARRPARAPWREDSEGPASAPHSMLHKKADEPRKEPTQGDRPHSDGPRGDRPRTDRPQSDRPYSDRPRGDRPYSERPHADRPGPDRPHSDRPHSDRPYGDRPRTSRPQGDRPQSDRPHTDRPHTDRPRGNRPFGDRPRTERPQGDKPYSDRPRGDRPYGDRPRTGRPQGDRPHSDRPRTDRPHSDRPYSERPHADRPGPDRPHSDRPRGDRPYGDRPRTGRPQGDRPRSDRPRSGPGPRRPPKP